MNRLLWPFPVFCNIGKPIGDGIYWPTNRPREEKEKKRTPENKTGEKGNSRADTDPNSTFASRRGSGERAAERRNEANRKGRENTGSPTNRFGKYNLLV